MIYALTNSKGGVGKSTLAVHLAVWLKEQGFNVALVDSDVQSSSSIWIHEVDAEIPIFRLQTPDDILEQIPRIRKDFAHLVVDGPAGLSEVTRTILLLADVTFLPCGPSVLDLRAANRCHPRSSPGATNPPWSAAGGVDPQQNSKLGIA